MVCTISLCLSSDISCVRSVSNCGQRGAAGVSTRTAGRDGRATAPTHLAKPLLYLRDTFQAPRHRDLCRRDRRQRLCAHRRGSSGRRAGGRTVYVWYCCVAEQQGTGDTDGRAHAHAQSQLRPRDGDGRLIYLSRPAHQEVVSAPSWGHPHAACTRSPPPRAARRLPWRANGEPATAPRAAPRRPALSCAPQAHDRRSCSSGSEREGEGSQTQFLNFAAKESGRCADGPWRPWRRRKNLTHGEPRQAQANCAGTELPQPLVRFAVRLVSRRPRRRP